MQLEQTNNSFRTNAFNKYLYLFTRYLHERPGQGLVYLDAEGVISSVNTVAERLLGAPRNTLIGRKLVDCWPTVIKEDGSCLPLDQHPALVALQTGNSIVNVVLGLFTNEMKKFVWTSVSLIPEFYKMGDRRSYRVLMAITDITDQKHGQSRPVQG